MNTKTFDPTKPCQTRDGRPVRILCTDGPDPAYPIVGFIADEHRILTWDNDGRNYFETSPDDLINIPEPPKLRPWKPEEVPVGCLVRSKTPDSPHNKYVLWSLNGDSVHYGRAGWTPLGRLFESHEHSTDHGKTWHPCGVIE